jgi:hypothetical protein
MISRASAAVLGILILLALPPAEGRGAQASLIENFDNGAPNFVATPPSAWGWGGGWYGGNATCFNGGAVVISSAVALGNVSGQSFTVSTTFSMATSTSGVDFRVTEMGLVALGNSADLTNGGYRLTYGVSGGYDRKGKLSLARTDAGPWNVAPRVLWPHFEQHLYVMRLSGEYVNGVLYLTGSIDDGTDTISTSIVDSAPLNGTTFGLRQSATVSAPHIASISVNYDNFFVILHDTPGGEVTEAPLVTNAADPKRRDASSR